MYINSDWWWQDFENVSSTNDIAYEFSFNPPDSQYVISAKRQTSGRGRRGRSWQSLDGNLFFSLVLQASNELINHLPFICSLALKDTILSLKADIDITFKWPNDVLIEGAKISGILLEKAANNYLIIGIGVNLMVAPEDKDIIYPTTFLKKYDIDIDRYKFLQQYLQFFDVLLLEWKQNGSAYINQKWLLHAIGLGKKIIINTEKTSHEGIFSGIDNNGALLLDNNGQISKIYAGDVFIKPESK